MRILEVANDKKLQKEFLEFPVKLYAQDTNWIRPLDQDIENTFNPAKNKHFNHGECIRWILQSDTGETIGRVAAFINHETAKNEEQPTGGMGFLSVSRIKKLHFCYLIPVKNGSLIVVWRQWTDQSILANVILLGLNDKRLGL
jgi:hypothetical protein